MDGSGPVATLIGDVVGSREVTDRAALHRRLTTALAAINDGLAPAVPLRITVGDEYQGVFEDVGTAIAAAFRLRLALHPDVDVRHGVGWGTITVLDAEPRVEDGPGWWAARAAIVAVEDASGGLQRALRTAYRRAEAGSGPEPDAVNAALLCRDALLAGASSRSWGVLRGLLGGMSQTEIARAEDISASAVSQRVRNDGLAALVAADGLLAGLR